MLNPVEQLKLSEYAGLYDRIIPENHILRKFNELVDFDFIYEELEEKYCLTNGRIAISPILLFKYLILKVMYKCPSNTLSDCVRKTTSSTLPRSPSSASCASRTATFSTSCSRNPSKSLSRTASSKAGTSSWMPRTPKRATT